jgi:2'-5' RNA ligase
MGVSVWGSFALVSYVPDPLGSSLDGLRQSFPGSDPAHSHITILPPRPLHLPVERASEQATSILRKFQAFEVELEAVSTFPHTNVVYLDLSEGNRLVRELHQALNTGNLADNEQFEFHPHLTLGGPIAEAAVRLAEAEAKQAWNLLNLPKRFLLDQIVALWTPPDAGPSGVWTRLWTYSLRLGVLQQHNKAAISRTS